MMRQVTLLLFYSLFQNTVYCWPILLIARIPDEAWGWLCICQTNQRIIMDLYNNQNKYAIYVFYIQEKSVHSSLNLINLINTLEIGWFQCIGPFL